MNSNAVRPADLTGRHPATVQLLRWFEYDHLLASGPIDLRGISAMFHDLAYELVRRLPDGPELSAGLRKLIEAKDCAVRAAVAANDAAAAREG